MAEPFVAEVRMWATNFAPRGWAACDGQLLPIAQNTALFSLIGTTYGGDGRTTLGLPNLQGRAPMHPGNGPGLTSRRIGERGGTETETLGTQQVPPHTHAVKATTSPASSFGPGGTGSSALARSVGGAAYSTDTTTASLDTTALGNVGGGQPHTNLQPYQVVTFCIALQGIFPPRS